MTMARTGQVLIDEAATIVAVDPGFCQIMRASADRFVGRSMLDITAPADRQSCQALFARLSAGGPAFVTTKRLLRDDGSHVWVETSMAPAPPPAEAEARHYAARVTLSVPPSDWVEPGILLAAARAIRASRLARASVFDRHLFADHAWDILIAAYIAEAEGSVLTLADIQSRIDLGVVNASRWVRALQAAGLMDYEDGGTPDLPIAPIRLSSSGHQRFELYLNRVVTDNPRAAERIANRDRAK